MDMQGNMYGSLLCRSLHDLNESSSSADKGTSDDILI